MAQKSIKAGILAYFIVEWTPHGELEGLAVAAQEGPVWTVYTDGAWGASGAGCSAVVTSPGGQVLRFSAALQFKTTNNTVEYEGILLGLRQAHSLVARRLILFCDSQLASAQLSKDYQAKDPELVQYVQKVREMDKLFLGFEVRNIRRTENEEADAIAKAAAGQRMMPAYVLHEVRRTASIAEGEAPKLVLALNAGD